MSKKEPAPEEYPDLNGNGVPDAFENRLPITEYFRQQDEIDKLQEEAISNNTAILEIEIEQRPAELGEMYMLGIFDSLNIQYRKDSTVPVTIVRRIIASSQPLPLGATPQKSLANAYAERLKLPVGYRRCPIKETSGMQRQCILLHGHSKPHRLKE